MSRGRSIELQGALAGTRNLAALRSQLPWIQKRAIQTLTRRLPVEGRRDIQGEYNIRAARVNKDLSVGVTKERVRLVGHWRGIGLNQFGANRVKRGVTASVFRGDRRLYEGKFKARLLSGNEQVVERLGDKRVMSAGRYKGKRRQPLATVYGPTVAQMLGKGRRPERLVDFAAGMLRAEVDRLFTSFYKRSASPGS